MRKALDVAAILAVLVAAVLYSANSWVDLNAKLDAAHEEAVSTMALQAAAQSQVPQLPSER